MVLKLVDFLFISVQQHFKGQKRKLCSYFEEIVLACFGKLPVFRNSELRHAATTGQTAELI